MTDETTSLSALRERVADFVRAREWQVFHNPKDLACAIAIEAAELQELFLWKVPKEVDTMVEMREHLERIEEELADIVILCLSLANRLKIDVSDAVISKVAANDAKYPVEVVRGRAEKYTYYRCRP